MTEEVDLFKKACGIYELAKATHNDVEFEQPNIHCHNSFVSVHFYIKTKPQEQK